MTIKELLESLPKEKRELAAEFLYGRTHCRLMMPSTTKSNTQEPLQISLLSSQEYPA